MSEVTKTESSHHILLESLKSDDSVEIISKNNKIENGCSKNNEQEYGWSKRNMQENDHSENENDSSTDDINKLISRTLSEIHDLNNSPSSPATFASDNNSQDWLTSASVESKNTDKDLEEYTNNDLEENTNEDSEENMNKDLEENTNEDLAAQSAIEPVEIILYDVLDDEKGNEHSLNDDMATADDLKVNSSSENQVSDIALSSVAEDAESDDNMDNVLKQIADAAFSRCDDWAEASDNSFEVFEAGGAAPAIDNKTVGKNILTASGTVEENTLKKYVKCNLANPTKIDSNLARSSSIDTEASLHDVVRSTRSPSSASSEDELLISRTLKRKILIDSEEDLIFVKKSKADKSHGKKLSNHHRKDKTGSEKENRNKNKAHRHKKKKKKEESFKSKGNSWKKSECFKSFMKKDRKLRLHACVELVDIGSLLMSSVTGSRVSSDRLEGLSGKSHSNFSINKSHSNNHSNATSNNSHDSTFGKKSHDISSRNKSQGSASSLYRSNSSESSSHNSSMKINKYCDEVYDAKKKRHKVEKHKEEKHKEEKHRKEKPKSKLEKSDEKSTNENKQENKSEKKCRNKSESKSENSRGNKSESMSESKKGSKFDSKHADKEHSVTKHNSKYEPAIDLSDLFKPDVVLQKLEPVVAQEVEAVVQKAEPVVAQKGEAIVAEECSIVVKEDKDKDKVPSESSLDSSEAISFKKKKPNSDGPNASIEFIEISSGESKCDASVSNKSVNDSESESSEKVESKCDIINESPEKVESKCDIINESSDKDESKCDNESESSAQVESKPVIVEDRKLELNMAEVLDETREEGKSEGSKEKENSIKEERKNKKEEETIIECDEKNEALPKDKINNLVHDNRDSMKSSLETKRDHADESYDSIKSSQTTKRDKLVEKNLCVNITRIPLQIVSLLLNISQQNSSDRETLRRYIITEYRKSVALKQKKSLSNQNILKHWETSFSKKNDKARHDKDKKREHSASTDDKRAKHSKHDSSDNRHHHEKSSSHHQKEKSYEEAKEKDQKDLATSSNKHVEDSATKSDSKLTKTTIPESGSTEDAETTERRVADDNESITSSINESVEGKLADEDVKKSHKRDTSSGKPSTGVELSSKIKRKENRSAERSNFIRSRIESNWRKDDSNSIQALLASAKMEPKRKQENENRRNGQRNSDGSFVIPKKRPVEYAVSLDRLRMEELERKRTLFGNNPAGVQNEYRSDGAPSILDDSLKRSVFASIDTKMSESSLRWEVARRGRGGRFNGGGRGGGPYNTPESQRRQGSGWQQDSYRQHDNRQSEDEQLESGRPESQTNNRQQQGTRFQEGQQRGNSVQQQSFRQYDHNNQQGDSRLQEGNRQHEGNKALNGLTGSNRMNRRPDWSDSRPAVNGWKSATSSRSPEQIGTISVISSNRPDHQHLQRGPTGGGDGGRLNSKDPLGLNDPEDDLMNNVEDEEDWTCDNTPPCSSSLNRSVSSTDGGLQGIPVVSVAVSGIPSTTSGVRSKSFLHNVRQLTEVCQDAMLFGVSDDRSAKFQQLYSQIMSNEINDNKSALNHLDKLEANQVNSLLLTTRDTTNNRRSLLPTPSCSETAQREAMLQSSADVDLRVPGPTSNQDNIGQVFVNRGSNIEPTLAAVSSMLAELIPVLDNEEDRARVMHVLTEVGRNPEPFAFVQEFLTNLCEENSVQTSTQPREDIDERFNSNPVSISGQSIYRLHHPDNDRGSAGSLGALKASNNSEGNIRDRSVYGVEAHKSSTDKLTCGSVSSVMNTINSGKLDMSHRAAESIKPTTDDQLSINKEEEFKRMIKIEEQEHIATKISEELEMISVLLSIQSELADVGNETSKHNETVGSDDMDISPGDQNDSFHGAPGTPISGAVTPKSGAEGVDGVKSYLSKSSLEKSATSAEKPCSSSDNKQAENSETANPEKILDPKELEDLVVTLARNCLKPHYHKGKITSQEYKFIMRKAISKITASKSGDINEKKVNKFINAYVEKMAEKTSLIK